MDAIQHKKLRDDIVTLIEKFEEETGFMVSDIEIHRNGCSSSVPYQIMGLYVPIVPKKS